MRTAFNYLFSTFIFISPSFAFGVGKGQAYGGAAYYCGLAIPTTIFAGIMAFVEPVALLFYIDKSAVPSGLTVDAATGQIRMTQATEALAARYMERYVYEMSGLRPNQACRVFLRQIIKSEVPK